MGASSATNFGSLKFVYLLWRKVSIPLHKIRIGVHQSRLSFFIVVQNLQEDLVILLGIRETVHAEDGILAVEILVALHGVWTAELIVAVGIPGDQVEEQQGVVLPSFQFSPQGLPIMLDEVQQHHVSSDHLWVLLGILDDALLATPWFQLQYLQTCQIEFMRIRCACFFCV